MTHMTRTPLPRLAAIALASAALAGCATSNDPAGMTVGAAFGDATAINHQLLKGDGALVQFNDRFAAAVPEVVTFDFDSAVLTPEARAALDAQAAFMRRVPELAFSLYGHADAPGSSAYNRNLGERRARAVLDYLVMRGIARSRLEALVSFGEARPAVAAAGRERANRRVVTQVSGFGRPGNPIPLDGKYAKVIYDEFVASATPEPADNQQPTLDLNAE